LGARFFGHWRW